jgi:hypothetical protein
MKARDDWAGYQRRRRERIKAEAADLEKYGELYRDMERIGTIRCTALAMVEAWPRIDQPHPGASIDVSTLRRLRKQ